MSFNRIVKIAHTADVHFGVENYGKIDPATGLHSRLLDFVAAFSFCISKAITEQVDLFILAGDAYKTANPTPTQQKMLLKQLFRLYQAGIPVVIVVGNHDHPMSFGKVHALDVYGDLPVEGFYVFSQPEAKTIITKSGPIQIVGIPWPSRQHLLTKDTVKYKDSAEITQCISQAVSAKIAQLASQLDPELPAILTGHLTVSTGIFSGSERCAVFGTDPTFMTSELAIPPFDYVALGHLHRHQNLNPGGTPVVYAGSCERIDFGEVRDVKGFCLVSIETKKENNAKSCSYDFIPTPTRPMVEIKIKLKPESNFTTQIISALRQTNIQDAILKISYEIPPEAKDGVDLATIENYCRQAWFVVGINAIITPATRTARWKKEQDKLAPSDLLANFLQHKHQTNNCFDLDKTLQLGKEILQEAQNESEDEQR